MTEDTPPKYTKYATPIETTFKLQRTALEGSQQAITQGVEFQRRLNAAALEGFGTQDDLGADTVELTRDGLQAYLDVLEASLTESAGAVDTARETIDEQLDAIEEGRCQAVEQTEAQFEEGVDAYDAFATESIEALDEQVEFLLDAHADVEEATLSAFEQSVAGFAHLQSQVAEQGEQFQAQFQEQTEQFQARLDQFRSQLEAMADRVEDIQRESLEA